MSRPTTLALSCLLALVGLAAGALPARAVAADAEHHVVVLHTNDVHGQVLPRAATWLKDVNPIPDSGGLPRLAGHLRRIVREETGAGAAVVVVDGGDWFQGTPESQLERGLGFLRAMAAVGYDAAAVGNHEFDHGVDVFLEHLEAVEMPALLANVRMPDGAPLPGTRDHVIVERAGLRIGLVGLLTLSTPSITHRQTKDLLWEPPVEALARVRAALADEVDLVVPVTHMGIDEDVQLARAHPDLPLIVGGHSHTFLRKGVREGGTLVVQAGAKASVIGRVDLWLDGDGRVVRSEARHVDLYAEPASADRVAEVDRVCAELVRRAEERMAEVVGVLSAPLGVTRRRHVNSASGSFIADIMRARTGADVAVHNRGGIRTSLAAGPVTRRDLFMLLPFDNHVETLVMEGTQVQELFRQSIEEGGRLPLEFSGAELRVREDGRDSELLSVRIGGEPLDPERRYRLATNSFLAAGGDGWALLAEPVEREVDFILLRELAERAFGGGVLVPPVDQRYEIER